MAFTGIPEDAVIFYAELAHNQTRAWWQENKARYQANVREPLEQLCAQLSDEFGEAKLYRPNRDLRFAKDKSPYKDHQGAHAEAFAAAGYYVQVGVDGLLVAGGCYATAPDQVARYRAAVSSDLPGEELARIVEELRGSGFEPGGDVMKTKPRGVDPDHPRLDLLRHRTLTVSRGFDEPWVYTPEVVEQVRQQWRTMRPLVDWLSRHVGASSRSRPR